MTGPLVTIVIPVFNGENFLAAAIESALAQDYEACEVIVVDDGSTDGSAGIARSFGDVRYVYQENTGPDDAKNSIVMNYARGEYYANVDADDILPRTKISAQMGYLLSHPEVDCVLGRQEWINPPPWLTRDHRFGDLDGIPMNSLVLRTEIIRELGGFIDAQGGDIDFLVRLRQEGYRLEVLDEVVLHRRYHGDNRFASQKSTGPMPLISLKNKLDRDRARAKAKTA